MNSLNFQILPANSTHLQEVQDLAHKIWYEHYPGIITHEQIAYMLEQDYAISRLEDDLKAGIFLDRLLVDNQLQGFAAYGKTGLKAQAKLHKLYVAVAYHRKGLGRALLTRVESVCRCNRFTQIILQVNKENDKAIRSYLRNGYYKQDEIIQDIGNGFVMDDFILAKDLSQTR